MLNVFAIAGINVTAVAPLPMTTTFYLNSLDFPANVVGGQFVL